MYVYILQSISKPEKFYVGLTENLKERLISHNQGISLHTQLYRSWRLHNALWFRNKAKAVLFEKFLKSHAGRSFQKKHF